MRRLTCVTACEAVKAVQKEDVILAELTGHFRCSPEELPARWKVCWRKSRNCSSR